MTQMFYSRKTIILFCLLVIAHFANAQEGKIKGRVTNGNEVLPAATISLGSKTVLSDAKGEFIISIKPGRYVITVSYAGYDKIEGTVTVENGTEQSIDLVMQSSGQMKDVIVLGSRSLKERSNLNTAVPIDLIQLSKQPTRQVELTKIIINNIPSFNATAHGFGQGKHMLPASLRGLGPDQALVLLNGRRLHPIASPWTMAVNGFGTVGVDLNTIPSAAIETVEVLRDGAAAQYGSDAIAGVISLQLKKTTGITSIDFHAGQYYEGDGEAVAFSINHGFKFIKKGYLNFTGQFRFNNYTQRTGIYDSSVYYIIPQNATPRQKDSLRNLDNQKVAERGFDRANLRPVGDNKVWNTSFVMNGGYPVSTNTNLFWTSVWNYRFVRDRGSSLYRFPKDSAIQVNMRLYPDGFLPILESTIPDITVIGGIDGLTNSGWRWDASVSVGKNSNRVDVKNSNNASQFADGSNAPTEFYTGKQIFLQAINNINFSKELFRNKHSIRSLNVAFGTELRIDHYRIKEGEEASWKNYSPASGRLAGAQGQSGFAPENVINKSRRVIAGYGEIEMEKSEKLLLNAAARYEYYSDYGDNLAGKLAIRYRFSRHILWRGSVSNGFRAPALQQRYYSLVTTIASNSTTLLRTGTFSNDHPIARAFGIAPLEAEKTLNFSTGITSSFSKNISITIDAYWIQVKDRIIYSGNIRDSFPEVKAILTNSGFTDVRIARFFSNAINTRTRGLDIIINGNWPVKNAVIETSVAANFNKTSLYGAVQYAKNLPDNEKFRNLLVNREERCRVENVYPRDKIILNISYRRDKLKINSNFTRYGRVLQRSNNPFMNPDEEYSPKILTALNVSYKLRSWLSLTLGAENMLDIYPDKHKHKNNTANGVTPYGMNFAAFGVNGGYYFINTSLRF
ncbi:MAG TPA: TonB-dependent receptor [Chitinophagaceae bacterium]